MKILPLLFFGALSANLFIASNANLCDVVFETFHDGAKKLADLQKQHPHDGIKVFHELDLVFAPTVDLCGHVIQYEPTLSTIEDIDIDDSDADNNIMKLYFGKHRLSGKFLCAATKCKQAFAAVKGMTTHEEIKNCKTDAKWQKTSLNAGGKKITMNFNGKALPVFDPNWILNPVFKHNNKPENGMADFTEYRKWYIDAVSKTKHKIKFGIPGFEGDSKSLTHLNSLVSNYEKLNSDELTPYGTFDDPHGPPPAAHPVHVGGPIENRLRLPLPPLPHADTHLRGRSKSPKAVMEDNSFYGSTTHAVGGDPRSRSKSPSKKDKEFLQRMEAIYGPGAAAGTDVKHPKKGASAAVEGHSTYEVAGHSTYGVAGPVDPVYGVVAKRSKSPTLDQFTTLEDNPAYETTPMKGPATHPKKKGGHPEPQSAYEMANPVPFNKHK